MIEWTETRDRLGKATARAAAFFAVIAITNTTGDDRIEALAGMGRRSPWLHPCGLSGDERGLGFCRTGLYIAPNESAAAGRRRSAPRTR